MEIDDARWWSLQRLPGETLRAALERTLRDAILSGTLRAGVRLPASRTLAAALGVSRGVVTDAYDQLQTQGFVVIRPRSAPTVTNRISGSIVPPAPEIGPPALPRYDLAPWEPDFHLFPLRRWMSAAQRVARECDWPTLGYREYRGERVLRDALADRLGRTRGVIADPEQIIITQGSTQSVDLLLRVLRALRCTRFAVEDPSNPIHHKQVRANGLTLVSHPTDGAGLVVDGLRADAVLVTPAHQYPTGSVMSGERRLSLVGWAGTTDSLIIEDDHDAEFRYRDEPIRALQGLAADRVAHLGAVSMTLVPALRLGWLVVPPALLEEATRQKRLVDGFSPVLDQLTLASFLQRGEYDRHVRKARAVYRSRRDALVRALATHLPELDVTGDAAGLHVLLRLPAGIDDVAIARSAWEKRMRVRPLSSFYLRGPRANGLVIGYGRLHEASAMAVIGELAAVVRVNLQERACAGSTDAPPAAARRWAPRSAQLRLAHAAATHCA